MSAVLLVQASRLAAALCVANDVATTADLCRDDGFCLSLDALLSVTILTTRSSPKSHAIDRMPIPILAPLTLPTYSASPEGKTGAGNLAS